MNNALQHAPDMNVTRGARAKFTLAVVAFGLLLAAFGALGLVYMSQL
jgi:hypothetical protein